MAYGVIMGQTPILSASGIEYDNSQTASVITGNNVQQAIDESVKKIESVESKVDSGVQWELLVNERVQGVENTTDGHIYPLIASPLKNKYLSQYGALFVCAHLTVTPAQNDFTLYFSAYLGKITGIDMEQGKTLGILATRDGVNKNFDGGNRNDNRINENSNLAMNYSSSTTQFNYDITFQIYGLKALI